MVKMFTKPAIPTRGAIKKEAVQEYGKATKKTVAKETRDYKMGKEVGPKERAEKQVTKRK